MYYKAILNYKRTTSPRHVYRIGYSTRLQREMGFTHEEFARCLPLAVAGNLEVLQKDPGHYRISSDSARVAVKTRRLPPRHAGSLVIPVLEVSIEYQGPSENHYDAFMQKFDRHFLRMGG